MDIFSNEFYVYETCKARIRDRLKQESRIREMLEQWECETKRNFTKNTVAIPWYLKPFRRVINEIAFTAFKDGAAYKGTDTVKVNKPNEY
jgi:hypothetical protein